MRRYWPLFVVAIAFAWVALFVAAVAGVTRCYRRDVAFLNGKRDAMRRELATMPPPPGAATVSTDDSFKPGLTSTDGHALVGAKYTVALSWPELRSRYDALAVAHGWRVACERPLRDWGRDLGGRFREYRKGELRASLQYAGERDHEAGWTYAFDLTWGMPGDCR